MKVPIDLQPRPSTRGKKRTTPETAPQDESRAQGRLAHEMSRKGLPDFLSAFEQSSIGMALVAPDGSWLRVNRALCEIVGYSEQELLTTTFQAITHPDDLEADLNGVRQMLAGEIQSYRKEKRYIHKNGRAVWILLSVTLVRDSSGAPRYFFSQIQDIGERKQAEAERQVIFEIIHAVNVTGNLDELLRRIHQSLKQVVYAENCFVALLDRSTGLFSFPFFVDRFDSPPPPQKLEKSCTAYVFREGRPMLIPQALFDRLVEQGEVELVGTPSPSWLGVPLKTPSATIGVLVMQHYEDPLAYTERDLEFLSSVGGQIAVAIERKLTESTVERLRRQNDLILISAGEGIYGLDLQGNVTFANPAAVSMLRWSARELIGRSGHELVHHTKPDGSPFPVEECPIYAALHDGAVHQVDTELFWRKDGTSFPVQYTSTPMRDKSGQPIGAVVVFEDITERLRFDEQLRRAQKMEAVGRLAGGVAHDFNNLLMVIKGHGELLLESLTPSNPLHRSVEQIHRAVDRAGGLTRQLLAFSRMQVLEPRVLDLNAVVADLGKTLPQLLGKEIEFRFTPGAAQSRVKADPGQLEQVILNLAINARDAMPQGGKLTIETSSVALDEDFARRHPPTLAGNYVMLAVSDTGQGMDAETQARIFEPFFTTKEKGKGTGLGLATVYGIIKQSGGFIWVYSEPGKGATFKIYLPQVDSPVDTAASNTATAPRLSGSETILLVEDEEEVRELARDRLKASGYTVLEAGDGAAALEVAQRHRGPIHLLVTDVKMPKVTGPQLADRLAALRPDVKIIFISAYLEYSPAMLGGPHKEYSFIQKPFSLETLERRVREVLEARVTR